MHGDLVGKVCRASSIVRQTPLPFLDWCDYSVIAVRVGKILSMARRTRVGESWLSSL